MTTPGKLGRYEILRQIGRGAMGVVYLARDPVIGRKIALKTVRFDGMVQGQAVELARPRFEQEARSAGILSHPNIVTVYDVVDEDGAIWIAMEYVDGTNLSDLLRRPDPFPLEFTLETAAQIADALDYAHSKRVIHRDIKPGNVIIEPTGRPKITDFGIAHLIDTALSEELRFLGTPNYMAPERIRGKEVDQRADLFSLGVVLYQMVTRRMPFEGETVAALTRAISTEDFIPPERFAPGLPSSVVAIIAKSLEKDPERRYQHARQMAADLRQVMSSRAKIRQTQPLPGAEPETVGSTAKPTTRARPARRLNRWWPVAAGLALIAAVAAWALRPEPAAPEPVTPPPVAPREPAPEHLPVLREGIERAAAGDLEAAAGLLHTAQLMAPESDRVGLWTAFVEHEQAVDHAARLEIEVQELLRGARADAARGRLGAAAEAVDAALALAPGHADAEALRRQIATAQARPIRRPIERETAEVPAPLVPATTAKPAPPPPPQPVSPVGTLIVDFESERSKGSLTIYHGEEQLLREAFRFVERTRFFISKGTAGAFQRTLELPSGSVELKVYLSLPGKETQLETVKGTLQGGTTRALQLRVTKDGSFSARLQ